MDKVVERKEIDMGKTIKKVNYYTIEEAERITLEKVRKIYEDNGNNHDDVTLPNGYKPIVMENVEEFLRSKGAIDTNEFLKIINKYR